MRLTTLKKNESDIRLLAQRLYPGLNENTRRQVESALLKANPHLFESGAFRPGIVVSLPSIPDFKPKPGVVSDDPVDEMRTALAEAIKDYKKILDDRMHKVIAEVVNQQDMLQRQDIEEALKNFGPDAQELAKKLAESLDEQRKTLEKEVRSQADLFPRIMKDLESLPK